MSSKPCSTMWSSLARPHILVSAAAAVMLTACSADTERFASNPSDADPVYTASVPKNVPKLVPDSITLLMSTSGRLASQSQTALPVSTQFCIVK